MKSMDVFKQKQHHKIVEFGWRHVPFEMRARKNSELKS